MDERVLRGGVSQIAVLHLFCNFVFSFVKDTNRFFFDFLTLLG